MDDESVADHIRLPSFCALCHRILSTDNEVGDLDISLCGDCNFLFIDDLGTPIREVQHRRTRGFRRRRYHSSESAENLFSQQFLHMINLATQNQLTGSEIDNESLDGNAAVGLVHRSSSRTTPSGSRRWRVLSDTENDGLESTFGETESNISFSRYRLFRGESDAISQSAYGGDSDASLDGRSFLENETFVHPDGGSDLDTDTDIDPMHAGHYHWDSDDLDEEDEDNELEEADAEENAVDSFGAESQLHRSLSSAESSLSIDWHRQIHSLELDGAIHFRIQERRQAHNTDVYANLEESDVLTYVGNSRDYLDGRAFEELLEHLADTDSSRRGAPPAAVSFVNNLPRIVINEDHERQDDLSCAICKDSLCIGTVVNQLPCFHLYHPSCILPWLNARNSCPLCRYELPTDDKEYEDRKQRNRSGLLIHDIQRHDMNDYNSSDSEADEPFEYAVDGTAERVVVSENVIEESSGTESSSRWFLLAAAAPIVSIVGFVLVLWLGNPLTETERPGEQTYLHLQPQSTSRLVRTCPQSQRENGSSRRWWPLF